MNKKTYAVFIIKFDRQNQYGLMAHRRALATIEQAKGFVEITDNVFIVDLRVALSTIISLHWQRTVEGEVDRTHNAFGSRFSILRGRRPCKRSVQSILYQHLG